MQDVWRKVLDATQSTANYLRNMPVYLLLGGKKPLVMSSKACTLFAR